MIPLPRRQSRKKILLVIVLVILALGAAATAGAYMYFQRQSNQSATKKQPSAPPTVSADRLEVDPHDHDPAAEQHGVDGIHTTDESAGAAAFPTTQPNLVVQITGVKQIGAQLVATTTVTPKAEGTCTAELTRPDNPPISKPSPLVATGDGSSCKDTTLDVSQAARGEWSLTLKVQVGNNVATATKAVTLK